MFGNMLQESDIFHIRVIGSGRLTQVWSWEAAVALSTSNLSLYGEAVMAAPHYQPDRVWNHLDDTPLSMSERVFPGRRDESPRM